MCPGLPLSIRSIPAAGKDQERSPEWSRGGKAGKAPWPTRVEPNGRKTRRPSIKNYGMLCWKTLTTVHIHHLHEVSSLSVISVRHQSIKPLVSFFIKKIFMFTEDSEAFSSNRADSATAIMQTRYHLSLAQNNTKMLPI